MINHYDFCIIYKLLIKIEEESFLNIFLILDFPVILSKLKKKCFVRFFCLKKNHFPFLPFFLKIANIPPQPLSFN